MFVFLTMLILFPTVVFQHFSKSHKRVGWLDDGHDPSPTLCDPVSCVARPKSGRA